MSKPKILVIGDVMLDRFINGSVDRMSPEAPVPVLVGKDIQQCLGGAANVALNLVKLDCRVDLIGVVGIDQSGEELNGLLEASGLSKCIELKERTTTTKTRYLSRGKQLLRVDHESTASINISVVNAIIKRIKDYEPNIILISDYAKGVVTKELMNAISIMNIKTFVDPKGSDWSKYYMPFLIKPNYKELKDIDGRAEDEELTLEEILPQLTQKYTKNLILTRGDKGMTWSTKNEVSHYPVQTQTVYDVTGAGDTALAVLAKAYSEGNSIQECIRQANLASSYVVTQQNTFAITNEKLNEIIR